MPVRKRQARNVKTCPGDDPSPSGGMPDTTADIDSSTKPTFIIQQELYGIIVSTVGSRMIE